MPSDILPALAGAGEAAGAVAEVQVPDAWPGHLVPNFSDWHIGDIVLVASDAGKIGRSLQAAQTLSRLQSVRQFARFTHAALYVGKGMVIDVTPRDAVSRRSVWFYCQYRDLTLRRLPTPDFAESDLAAVARVAARHIGKPYSLLEAVMSKLLPSTEPNPSRLYCSTFVDLVIAEATGMKLSERREHRPLHPATIAAHLALIPVALEWRRVGGATTR